MIVGVERDGDGRITGFVGYEGEPDLAGLTAADRALWPQLAWLADGLDPVAARADHPVIGPLDRLIDGWCERRELSRLAQLLPVYLPGPSGLAGWERLLVALEGIRDTSDSLPVLPGEECEVIGGLVTATAEVVRAGRRG